MASTPQALIQLKTHRPVCFLLSYVWSITQQRIRKKASVKSIQPLWKGGRFKHLSMLSPPYPKYEKGGEEVKI